MNRQTFSQNSCTRGKSHHQSAMRHNIITIPEDMEQLPERHGTLHIMYSICMQENGCTCKILPGSGWAYWFQSMNETTPAVTKNKEGEQRRRSGEEQEGKWREEGGEEEKEQEGRRRRRRQRRMRRFTWWLTPRQLQRSCQGKGEHEGKKRRWSGKEEEEEEDLFNRRAKSPAKVLLGQRRRRKRRRRGLTWYSKPSHTQRCYQGKDDNAEEKEAAAEG